MEDTLAKMPVGAGSDSVSAASSSSSASEGTGAATAASLKSERCVSDSPEDSRPVVNPGPAASERKPFLKFSVSAILAKKEENDDDPEFAFRPQSALFAKGLNVKEETVKEEEELGSADTKSDRPESTEKPFESSPFSSLVNNNSKLLRK